jgi:proline dehydrogenase
MLRSFLIYLSKAPWAQKMVTNWGFAWRMASRFVAGEQMDDAIRAVRELNARGINATLDQLGEHTASARDADAAADKIIRLLEAIDKSDVCANVSIKLTQIGMGLDDAVCRANLARILAAAQGQGNFVRIDMEDSPYTDQTLELLGAMRALGYGPETVGTVLQSYLYRTEGDARRLLEQRTRLRLVKGAYREPVEVAFPKKRDVDANYDRLTALLLDAAGQQPPPPSGDGRTPPLAARNPRSSEVGLQSYAPSGCEDAGRIRALWYRATCEVVGEGGYPVRVYVPFGTHWYPYFMRRLAERPANIWFFVSNFFRK